MRVETRFALIISNKDLNHIIQIIKSLEDSSSVLIDGVLETVKHEIKKQEGGSLGALLAPLGTSIVQPVISSTVKSISGKGIRRAGREYMGKKILVPLDSLNKIKITSYFNFELRFNGIFSRNNLP